jgi:putative (di)nucleoside polyphosphate hydrolase
MSDSGRWRRGVGIMLLDASDRVFVGRRIDTPGAWQMPQGGIDAGETPRAAALRELKEETGIERAAIIAETPGWLRYELPPELRGRKIWGGDYRGQVQKWFAMRFLGEDGDIDLAVHHPEFDAWKWVPAVSLPGLIVPFKRALYADVLAAFKDLLEG